MHALQNVANQHTHTRLYQLARLIASIQIMWQASLTARLALLLFRRMTRPYTSTETQIPTLTAHNGQFAFANSSQWPSQNSVKTELQIANGLWEVYLEPQDGWRPDWEQGLIAAVVLGSFMVAALVAIIMASWAQQQRLLGDVLVGC